MTTSAQQQLESCLRGAAPILRGLVDAGDYEPPTFYWSRAQARRCHRYTGAQGMACFDEDPSREVRYRLDHVYARRTTKQAAEDEPDLPPAPADTVADA